MTPKFSLSELRRRLASAIATLSSDFQYAIGGAVAMAEHGYRRFSDDINIFVLESWLNPFEHALKDVGLEVFVIQEPSHYAAKLPGDYDLERRIDLLVPFSEPELSAVEFPATGRDGLRVFAPDLLAAVEFYAFDDSGDVKHALDLMVMYRRGIFDAALVRWMIRAVDPGRLKAYDQLLSTFEVKRLQPRSRPTKRIPRGALERKKS